MWNFLCLLNNTQWPFLCELLRKPSTWEEIRGNRCSKIKQNEAKFVCHRKINPGYHLYTPNTPSSPTPQKHLLTLPGAHPQSPGPDKNVHHHKRALIKQPHWILEILSGNKKTEMSKDKWALGVLLRTKHLFSLSLGCRGWVGCEPGLHPPSSLQDQSWMHFIVPRNRKRLWFCWCYFAFISWQMNWGWQQFWFACLKWGTRLAELWWLGVHFMRNRANSNILHFPFSFTQRS